MIEPGMVPLLGVVPITEPLVAPLPWTVAGSCRGDAETEELLPPQVSTS